MTSSPSLPSGGRSSDRLRVGILGASGYVGGELLRLLYGHPYLEVVLATAARHADQPLASVHPHLAAAYPGMVLAPTDGVSGEGLDVIFCALPHGVSAALVPSLLASGGLVVDLGADFRLDDPAAYPLWYGMEHPHPDLARTAVLGIPELYRDQVVAAGSGAGGRPRLIAAAGCYVTAASLALAPLVRAGAIEARGIVVDAASGVSGAGADPKPASHFGTVEESFSAYGLLTHRHTPEIEQAVGGEVIFTPHLVPMNRGILATCYARPTGSVDPAEILSKAYADSPFVWVSPTPPATKWVSGSNAAALYATVDPRTGWVLVLSVIDNLVKGAAGQAIQCANLALGLEETSGLPLAGMWP